MTEQIKIGDKFFARKETHRWNEWEFYEVTVLEETTRSWVLGKDPKFTYDHFKVPKKRPFSTGKLWTEQMAKERKWVEDHKHKIFEQVRLINDYDRLAALAKHIRYVS